MSGKALTLNIISKFNNNLKFLYPKNIFLTLRLGRPLCNVLIQLHFDYTCSEW